MKLNKQHILLWGQSLFCMLMFGIGITAYGQKPEEIYTNANALYKVNDYAAAASAYEKLLAQGYKDATIYYNLGNSYYRQGNIGNAILNYERAQKLLPEDEDIVHNLKIANAHITDKITPVPQLGIVTAWQNFTQSYSAKGWGLWAIAAAWLALVAGVLYLFTSFKNTGVGLGLFFVLITIAFASLALSRSNAGANSGEAVLMVADTYVKSAPDDNSTNMFVVHEGLKFSLLDKVGSYSKVRFADGKIGWVENSHYEKI